MKAILEFNLPEDSHEFDLANNAVGYKLAIEDLDNFLRSKLKYEEISATEVIIYQKIRDQLHAYLNDNDVSIH